MKQETLEQLRAEREQLETQLAENSTSRSVWRTERNNRRKARSES